MQHHITPADTRNQHTEFDPPRHLGHTLAWLARSLTVRQWWHEMDEPIDLLEDPEATFAEDGGCLAAICEEYGIVCQRGEQRQAFPVWVLREFYPENP